MIRHPKGNTQQLVTKAASTTLELYAKANEEFKNNAINEHAPQIRAWMRSYAEVSALVIQC